MDNQYYDFDNLEINENNINKKTYDLYEIFYEIDGIECFITLCHFIALIIKQTEQPEINKKVFLKLLESSFTEKGI